MVTNKELCLFVLGWFRDYSEFYSNIVVDDAHDYLVLIVNKKESKCRLDEEISVPKNIVARYIDIWQKKFAQVVAVRWLKREFKHLFCPCFSFNMK